jgi:DNA-directed RNA polymerase specialized sigma24 family protein
LCREPGGRSSRLCNLHSSAGPDRDLVLAQGDQKSLAVPARLRAKARRLGAWQAHPADIMAAIRVLPYRYRIMVYLADVKGLDYRQIADLTGVSIGTVKSSLHRGRRQLGTRLAGARQQDAALPAVTRRGV